jgi:hypothetical protein
MKPTNRTCVSESGKTLMRFILFIFLLTWGIFLGCVLSIHPPDSLENIVEITEIPVEYDGQNGYVRLGSTKTFDEAEKEAEGIISNGKLIEDVSDKINVNYPVFYFKGFGNLPIVVSLGDDIFIYTNGESFQELQIDVCAITENINNWSSIFFDKLPKIKFRDPIGEVIVTVIEFNKLQKLDYTECE